MRDDEIPHITIPDEPLWDVKQEENDLQRALVGDECDEQDHAPMVVIDDPYVDPFFQVSSEDLRGEDGMEATGCPGAVRSPLPDNAEVEDDVVQVEISAPENTYESQLTCIDKKLAKLKLLRFHRLFCSLLPLNGCL